MIWMLSENNSVCPMNRKGYQQKRERNSSTSCFFYHLLLCSVRNSSIVHQGPKHSGRFRSMPGTMFCDLGRPGPVIAQYAGYRGSDGGKENGRFLFDYSPIIHYCRAVLLMDCGIMGNRAQGVRSKKEKRVCRRMM